MTLFNDALEALTFADANDVNELAFSEGRNSDYIACLDSRSLDKANFAKTAVTIQAGLFQVAKGGLGQALLLLDTKAKLDGIVTIGLHGLDLDDRAWAGFDDCDRD